MLIKAIISIGLFNFNKTNEKICVNVYYFPLISSKYVLLYTGKSLRTL